jgi:hypothetical protein
MKMKKSARGFSIMLVDSRHGFTRYMAAAAALCCAMLLLATPVQSEPRIQPPDQSIQPADAGTVQSWGSAVAIDGDTAMIRGIVDEEGGKQSAIVEVYVRHRSGQWVYDSTILPPNEFLPNGFGENIALRGDVALITGLAPFDPTGFEYYNVVHVFRRIKSEWRYVQTVSAPTISVFDSFGRAMDLDGHTAVIGSFITNSAHVFRITRDGTLEFRQTLTADSPPATFARSVAIDGNTILVGAAGDLTNGAVYVFQRFGGEWHQTQKLVSSASPTSRSFGFTLALDDRIAVVDASAEDFVSDGNSAVRSGAAYVFVRSGGVWIEQQRLTGDPEIGFFGNNVALDNGHLLIQESLGLGAGQISRVLQFERIRGEWRPVAQFSRGPGLNELGAEIAISRSTALIGAPLLRFPVGDVLVYDLHRR